MHFQTSLYTFPVVEIMWREEKNTISIAYQNFVIALPNKLVVLTSGVTPLGAKFHLCFPILNCVHIVVMQLLETFKNDLFCSDLDLVAIIPEPRLELYN